MQALESSVSWCYRISSTLHRTCEVHCSMMSQPRCGCPLSALRPEMSTIKFLAAFCALKHMSRAPPKLHQWPRLLFTLGHTVQSCVGCKLARGGGRGSYIATRPSHLVLVRPTSQTCRLTNTMRDGRPAKHTHAGRSQLGVLQAVRLIPAFIHLLG